MSALPLLETAKKGLLLDCRVIDMHGHVGPWRNFYTPDLSPASLIKVMDSAGIGYSVLFSNAGMGSDHVLGNQVVKEFVAYNPKRLIPFVFPSGRYPEETERELRHYALELGWKGIKIHPDGNNYPADGANYRPIFRFAADHGLPVISHTWSTALSGVDVYDKIAAQYPTVPICCAHSFEPDFVGAVRLAQKYSNIYLELTDASIHNGVLEYLVKELGGEKLLFGSDALGWFSPLHALGTILYADISDDEKRKILGGTAQKILRL
jgi:uncharacterized protein